MTATIEATTPCVAPPAWALLQRELLRVLSAAVQPFLAKYTDEQGTLIWGDTWTHGRDGLDDLYESFTNWPMLYLLGGDDDLLPLSLRAWEATTRLGARFGLVHREYERGYDQFHQSESYIFFYTLCLADPTNPRLIEQARRFAGFYTGEDPDAPNYDPAHRLIRAPHNGSGGPRWGFRDGAPRYDWSASMRRYGLPFHDVPGITEYDDLRDPALAQRMGEVMHERMGKGDVPANLAVTSLIANAYLLTGEERYHTWLVEYVETWIARAEANGGLLPDNVGLSGTVGEYIGGKWYGGLYGWTWPHGFYNIEMAAIVAATNATLLTGERRYLDLPRGQLERILGLGELRPAEELYTSSLYELHQFEARAAKGRERVMLYPYRYGDRGWFDYQPMSPIFPAAIWNVSLAPEDWARLERVRLEGGYAWSSVHPFHTKMDSGHEQPWLRYLVGANPTYPEAILQAALAEAYRRLEQIRQDDADLTLGQVHIHHWQRLNPVTTEALVQLTLGAPQPSYNGGLLQAPVCYFDAERRRPGLPPDVAALVIGREAGRTVLRLVNLSPFHPRDLIVQAGAFGEHRFVAARFAARTSDYPGPIGSYAAPDPTSVLRTVAVDDTHLRVRLPPTTEITLDLETERYVKPPSYATPWPRAAG